jgi:hypothetical protein
MKAPGELRGATNDAVMYDDFSIWPTQSSHETSAPEKKKPMIGNTMMVSHSRYLELKATGRVRGGDPQATASEPIVYTDENGIEWGLSVHTSSSSTAGPDMNLGPRLPPITNRHARRAAKAQARRAK